MIYETCEDCIKLNCQNTATTAIYVCEKCWQEKKDADK